jgi:FkbM family methyltransferase
MQGKGMEMGGRIGLADRAIGHVMFSYRFFESSFNYLLISYLLIENWHIAIQMRGGVKKDCKIVPRSKSICGSISGRAVRIFARNIDDCMVKDGKIFLKYKGRPLIFSYTNDYQLVHAISGLKEQFIEGQYRDLDVGNKFVLDIGASIGDSATYFALRGAKSIVSLEPYPFTYRVAKKNMELNGLSKKVLVLNQACRSKRGSVTIDPNFQNNDRDLIRHFNKGKSITVTTLADLVKRYDINDAALKMDCEGYEYEIIGYASRDTLRRFNVIVIEYHYGYKSLVSKLEDAGFKVRHTLPLYMKKFDYMENLLLGFVYAERMDQ